MDEVILQLIFARHAESLGNVESDVIYNSFDPPLTPLGIIQAQKLGERLSHGRLDAIFASPLTRAVHTAHEVAIRQGGVRVELLPDLMEVGTAPNFEGCPIEILREEFPLALPCSSLPTPTGGGLSIGEEDYAKSSERAKRCIDYLRGRFNSGEKILVVSHGGFTGHFMRRAFDCGDDDNFRWCSFNTGLFKIKYYKDEKPKLAYSNDTSHLYSIMDDLAFRI